MPQMAPQVRKNDYRKVFQQQAHTARLQSSTQLGDDLMARAIWSDAKGGGRCILGDYQENFRRGQLYYFDWMYDYFNTLPRISINTNSQDERSVTGPRNWVMI